MLQTEFEFTLPKGYLDENGVVHRRGVMRLSRAMDEIVPLRDPRVKSNPAYATVMILSRVITKLGALDEVTPRVVEQFFTCDLDYLQKFYRQVNELEAVLAAEAIASGPTAPAPIAPGTTAPGPTAPPSTAKGTAPQPQTSNPSPPSQNIGGTSEADLFSSDGGPPMVPPSPRARAAASQS